MVTNKNGVTVVPPNPIHGWIQSMSNAGAALGGTFRKVRRLEIETPKVINTSNGRKNGGVGLVSDVVEKTSTRRRSRILCVVVEKNTTRRREGVGVVVEKKSRKSTNFQQNFV